MCGVSPLTQANDRGRHSVPQPVRLLRATTITALADDDRLIGCDRAAQEGSADEAEARIQRDAIAPQVDHQRESVRPSRGNSFSHIPTL
jgi:hypothetical protein